MRKRSNIQWIFVLLLSTFLAGCSNIELDELGATAASTGAALVTTAAGLPPVVTLTTTAAAGVAASAVTPPSSGPDVKDFRGEDGELSFAEALALMWANFTSHMLTIGILGIAFFVVWTYVGIRWKRPEEKAMEKQIGTLVDKIGKMKDAE